MFTWKDLKFVGLFCWAMITLMLLGQVWVSWPSVQMYNRIREQTRQEITAPEPPTVIFIVIDENGQLQQKGKITNAIN